MYYVSQYVVLPWQICLLQNTYIGWKEKRIMLETRWIVAQISGQLPRSNLWKKKATKNSEKSETGRGRAGCLKAEAEKWIHYNTHISDVVQYFKPIYTNKSLFNSYERKLKHNVVPFYVCVFLTPPSTCFVAGEEAFVFNTTLSARDILVQ